MAIKASSSKHWGFSLIELLVVLVLLMTVALLTAPGFSTVKAGLELQMLSRDIAQTLRQTRLMAIRSGKAVTWTIDLANHQYYIEGKAKQKYDKAIHIELTTIAKERISEQLGRIRFFANGSASGGQVKLHQGQIRHHVQINWLTGRVRLYHDQG